MSSNVPKMPESFIGETSRGGGYTLNDPRKWTEDEVRWCVELKEKGFSTADIASSVGRSEVSVQIKMKRLSKKETTYNSAHVEEKYSLNDKFCSLLKPSSVLDVYAGESPYWVGKASRVVTNDINTSFNVDNHMDSLKFLCKMWVEGEKFDIVDLDPFGSAFDCFDLAIKMAGKGLAVTFGELGHKRWKRLDFVSRYYGIHSLDDFTLDALVEYVQMVGLRNKKVLEVFDKREWRNIGRVWFTVKPYKVTEQWDKKEESVD